MASDYLVVVTSPSGMMVSDESFKTIEVIYSGTKLHILANSDEAGHPYRSEAGHRSDLKPATIPI